MVEKVDIRLVEMESEMRYMERSTKSSETFLDLTYVLAFVNFAFFLLSTMRGDFVWIIWCGTTFGLSMLLLGVQYKTVGLLHFYKNRAEGYLEKAREEHKKMQNG